MVGDETGANAGNELSRSQETRGKNCEKVNTEQRSVQGFAVVKVFFAAEVSLETMWEHAWNASYEEQYHDNSAAILVLIESTLIRKTVTCVYNPPNR